jgi:hypothetical protein
MMNSARPSNVVGLFCSRAVAEMIGAVPMSVPADTRDPTGLLREIATASREGAVIAVATLDGGYFLWPIRDTL